MAVKHCSPENDLMAVKRCSPDNDLMAVKRCSPDNDLMAVKRCSPDSDLMAVKRCSPDNDLMAVKRCSPENDLMAVKRCSPDNDLMAVKRCSPDNDLMAVKRCSPENDLMAVKRCSPDNDLMAVKRCSPENDLMAVKRCSPDNDLMAVKRCSPDNDLMAVKRCSPDSDLMAVKRCSPDSDLMAVKRCSPDSDLMAVKRCSPDNDLMAVKRCSPENDVMAVKRCSSQGGGVSPPKKVRTAPTNTSLLPPCKVCQEPAAGFHYGANTCEACKGFFRRSLLRTEAYRCLGRGNCNIRAGKRKICPNCRYKRCISVGMSKEAIKTGRYTHAKRTQDILEYQQIMQQNNIDDDQTFLPNHAATVLGNTISNFAATEAHNTSQMASTSPDNTSPPCLTPHSVPFLDGPFELSAVLSPSSVAHNMLDNLGRADEATSLSPTASSQSFQPQSLTSSVPSSLLASEVSQGSSKGDADLLDGAECERIVRHLLTTHKEHIIMPGDCLSLEEKLEKQAACHEACKEQVQMLGHGAVSHEDYQDVYQTTGLDVDNRQPFVGNIVAMLDEAIHQYIAFAKTIPGFSGLTLNDQIRLIKDNRCEFRMLSNFDGFNYELKVVTLPSGRTECFHTMSKILSTDQLLLRFECAKVIKKLGLSTDELILLKSWMVVTVGNEDVDEPEKVGALQWKITQCLHWLLQQNRKDADQTFARIMSGVCRVRELMKVFYDWLRFKPFDQYAQFQNNSLVSEWFSQS